MSVTPAECMAARKLLGCSQEKLAEMLFVGEGTIGQFERRRRRWPSLSLRKMRDLLRNQDMTQCAREAGSSWQVRRYATSGFRPSVRPLCLGQWPSGSVGASSMNGARLGGRGAGGRRRQSEEPTPVPHPLGRRAGERQALPDGRCDGVVDGNAELGLEGLDESRRPHVGADDRHGVAAGLGDPPDHGGDLRLSDLREGEIIL